MNFIFREEEGVFDFIFMVKARLVIVDVELIWHFTYHLKTFNWPPHFPICHVIRFTN